MMPLILNVHFFCTPANKEPVRAFLLEQTAEDRKHIGKDIKTVQLGWPLGMPLVRKIAPKLWEIRSHITDGIVRIFFTIQHDKMVLLHAFVKKSQQTPQHELDTALKRLKQCEE